MKKDRISIVTPSFNMATYLTQTIESVLSNMGEGDEYYIIDGGSNDNSVEIIKRYEGKITGWLSEKDDGYAHAISKGFERSSGGILCWINVGDVLLSNTLNIVRDEFKNSDVDLIYSDDYYINEEGIVIQHSSGKVYDLRNMMLYSGWTPLQDACYWRSSLYKKCSGINIKLQYAADYDLFLRMSAAGKCLYVPAVLSAFRKHKNQKSIANTTLYKKEREISRKFELTKIPSSSLLISIQCALHWIFIRIRARVGILNKRKSSEIGKNVSVVTGKYNIIY